MSDTAVPGVRHGPRIPYESYSALQERGQRLAEAQELVHLGTWAWNVGSGEVTCSDELCRIFGVRSEGFTSTYAELLARIDPAHRADAEAVVRTALVDGQPCAFDCPMARDDGSERWIRAVGVVDADRTGAPVRMHGTAQDITEFRSIPARGAALGDAALYDSLTGLANWQLFADRAGAALARGARNGLSTAMLVIDIDRFHHVNDQFGHDCGDQVLVEVARRLDAVFRPYDTVARVPDSVGRLGGDEFAVLCESIPDAAVARTLCRRIASLLEVPFDMAREKVSVTAGIGIALAPAGESVVEELIAHAESAMRSAKRRGRGGCAVFADGALEVEVDLGEAGRDLERALTGGELRLYYQPKVTLDSDRIVGAEALLRWEHPQRGTVAPIDFIPLAERTGLIIPIGSWVIAEACREAARWRRSFPGRPPLVVAVNVSARQFSPALVDVVARALSASDTPPATLCLEVTESLLMEDVEGTVHILEQLAALGVALSIDDFGTGYSSLAYLKRFPLDELKIDKSFVDGLGRDADATAIVAAVIAMAHALGLGVVAEGVETAEQLQRLRTLGCEQAQGYLFARPGLPSAIDNLLSGEAEAGWRSHTGGPPSSGTRSEAYCPDRILVVDDTPDVRQLATMSLAAVGFEVHEAVNGADALSVAKAVLPDCVLLDLVMPDMAGLEVCRALRAAPGTATCTILVITANDDPADKVEAFSCGADDYITKPFSPRDLVSRVHAAMRRRRHAAEHLHPPEIG